LFFVITLLAASGSFAANTGRLAGEVLDSDGAALPGVTVQISSAALIGGPQVAISGVQGDFAFNLLPVGVYTVEATLPGFLPSAGEVRVQADATASVVFRMVPEAFGGEVEVTAEVPVVDTSQVNSRQVWDEDYLQYATVGTNNRSYQTVLSQAAGVTGGSNPNVFGSTLGENAYLIDGMNTTDTVVGTWSTMFNMDAVQELNFQTGGFEAEFGQATGGIVNLVTKSGGNDFSGSFDARYRDQDMTENGDHFDKDEQQSSRQQYSFALGGPFLRDKLWFFTSLQYIDSTSQDVYDYFPYEWVGSQFLGKVTWQLSDSSRVIGKFSTDPAEIDGVNASLYFTESARATQEQGGQIWQFELNSVLSESWLLNAQLGTADNYLKAYSTDQPDTVSGHYNQVTELYENAYYRVDDDERPRDEARVNATWFVDNLAGSHEFKTGLEWSQVSQSRVFYYPGGGFFYDNNGSASATYDPIDLNGDGFFNHYVEVKRPEDRVKDPVETSGDIYTFFLQDAWRIHPNVTVKPGIRLDRSLLYNSLDDEIANMDRWQPRLGVAWDITGSSKHVIRASAGRFMDPTTLMIPGFASGAPIQNFIEYSTLEYYCNASRGLTCTVDSLPPNLRDLAFEWTNWNGQTYTLIDNRGETLSQPALTLDEAGLGELQAPYVDEIILAYEFQVAPQMSVELTYVNKEGGDLIEDTCIGNTWAYGQGPLPSLDDPDTWTLSANCERWLIVNMPTYERTYEAGIVNFEARKSWGHVLFSYTHSQSEGNNESGPRHYAYGAGDFYPVNFYNDYGYLGDHRDHRVKVNGYFLLPHRWTIGYDGFWSSAGHQTITSSCQAFSDASRRRSTTDQMTELGIDPATLAYCTSPDGFAFGSNYDINHSPRGSLETKSVWQLDLQVMKGFRIGKAEIEGILTVYNIFGQEWDSSFNSTAFRQDTEPDPETGRPVGLVYQDDDPSAPYYDEYYGADNSPVLVPIGAATSYWDPRRYEIGFRIEF
jgi:hypothetical protein